MTTKIHHTIVKQLYDRYVRTVQSSDPMCILTGLQQAYWLYIDHIAKEEVPFSVFVHCFVFLLRWQHSDVKPRLKQFWKFNVSIPRAGGILLNTEQTKLVLVRAPGSKRWSFPVGKVSPNEPEHKCAEREVFEETGYQGQAEANRSFTYRKRKALHTLFVFLNVPEDYTFVPMSCQEIGEVRWFAFSELIEVLPRTLRENLVHFLGVYVYPAEEVTTTTRGSSNSSSTTSSPELVSVCQPSTACSLANTLSLLSFEPFAPKTPWKDMPIASSSCVRI